MQFAISTHLFHAERLTADHLVAFGRHGFTALELFATRSHFDYRDPAAVDALAGGLEKAGLQLHAIHAPAFERYGRDGAAAAFSILAPEADERARAMREIEAALEITRRIPTGLLVLHLGTSQAGGGDARARGAAIRSLEAIQALAAPLGVRLAIEVIPNELSAPASLVRLLEDDVDLPDAGVCLDFGHALLMGDPMDAVETLSGHLLTTHVHDNHGRQDEHLPPFDGTLDWTRALMALQKIGYDGRLVLEVGGGAAPEEALARAARARDRLARMLGG